MITQAAFADALEKNPTVHVNGRFMSDSSRTQALEIGVRHLNSSQRVASLSTQPYCIRISLVSWGAECTVTSSRTAHFLSRKPEVRREMGAKDLRQQGNGIKRDGQTSPARDHRPVVG